IHFNTMDEDIAVDLVKVTDSEMVVLSSYVGGDSNNKKIALLYKIDSSRNIVWTRKYSIGSEHHNVYDLEKTDDGGFVFTGFVYPDGVHGQDTWIVKVDSMGCDVPLCYLGERELGLEIPLLKCYPNPTNNISTIELPDDSQVLELYDMQGRKIKEFNLENHLTQFQMDLAPFNNGIYILKLFSKSEKVIGQAKLVKR
ncbi:MAG: T9SS type A sorting domain-containing protein, partial [Crocinitomicaceae bacterium]